MKVTKFGHSCLYVEEGDARILIDPGSYVFKETTVRPEDIPAADVILLTHEHADHTDPDALRVILKKNAASIWTNAGVQVALAKHGIASEVIARGATRTMKGVSVRGIACDHGFISDKYPRVENIGFLVAGRLFDPGDCVTPSEEVHADILALPIAAPWMAVREAVDFALRVKPKVVIPIHDRIVRWPEMPWYAIIEKGLEGSGTAFRVLPIGTPVEL